jgi:selenium metabolism protein YedF
MAMIVDARGLGCPQPVIMTKEALDRAQGNPLFIMVSNEASRDNVMRFLENAGTVVDRVEQRDDGFSIHTKGNVGSSASEIKPEDYPCSLPPAGRGTTLFITRDQIGQGSEELGTNLLKAFIATVKNLSIQPGTICFMNSGVKLTIKGAETLDHLRELESRGIEILVCGTCLNYFGLTEVLGVGKISNMYDISETMLSSAKVITF